MAVALTVTIQGRELLPTISVTYVVIPGLPGPPSFNDLACPNIAEFAYCAKNTSFR